VVNSVQTCVQFPTKTAKVEVLLGSTIVKKVQATNGSGFFHFIEVTFTDNGQWAKIVPPYRVPQYERKKEKKKKKKKKKEEKRKRKRRKKEKEEKKKKKKRKKKEKMTFLLV